MLGSESSSGNISWKVLRDDGTVLGRYGSKPAALAAMVRFAADGCGYEVVQDAAARVADPPRSPIIQMTRR